MENEEKKAKKQFFFCVKNAPYGEEIQIKEIGILASSVKTTIPFLFFFNFFSFKRKPNVLEIVKRV